VKPHGLHAFRNPATLKDKVLHCSIDVEGKDHDPPPGGILPELARREPASGEALLPDGKILFGLAAPLMMPVDEFRPYSLPNRRACIEHHGT
jgi:hypothetical protein